MRSEGEGFFLETNIFKVDAFKFSIQIQGKGLFYGSISIAFLTERPFFLLKEGGRVNEME